MSIIKMTAQIMEAYVSNNDLAPSEIPELMKNIHRSLSTLGHGSALDDLQPASTPSVSDADPLPVTPKSRRNKPLKEAPAVSLDQAVGDEFVICLICGKSLSTLKGHLTRTHKMDVKAYQEKFDLPKGFPLVSKNYSAKRRELAIQSGLGEKLRAGRRKKQN
ncbi:MAG: MucR family transcriptional regulator [Magnetococcales bacterium]|nr:MucR family transcriptional regulator [Magnetococcales bacterium]